MSEHYFSKWEIKEARVVSKLLRPAGAVALGGGVYEIIRGNIGGIGLIAGGVALLGTSEAVRVSGDMMAEHVMPESQSEE